MNKELLAVDRQDNIIGYTTKETAHAEAILHRAFSIFIWATDTKKMLIQRRSRRKYHSGGKWSNSCCSHPLRGESAPDMLQQRLQDELGVTVPPMEVVEYPECDDNKYIYCGKFIYKAQLGELWEHELDHVYVLRTTQSQLEPLHCSPEEVEETQWISLQELTAWYGEEPEAFSAWFWPALQVALPAL